MKQIELLAPAGDLERLKIAIIYGADAVYIGGKQLSLRSAASNFTLEDIKEGCDFAHQHNAKIYVTSNIVMHNSETENLLEYLKGLESCGVDGVIASSLVILKMIKQYTKMEAHVSTQQSISNSKGIKFLESLNVDRVVLARECSLNNIKTICENTNKEIEVFIEGAMCSSFSGRCMLSNVMTGRDANRGGCAQPCRWNYNLYQGNQKVSLGEYDFSMASADLSAVQYVPALIEAGVASLKIEGRMKSVHYIATVVNAYRRVIDDYYNYKYFADYKEYQENLKRGQNRPVSIGFFNGDITPNEVIYNQKNVTASHDFVGIILDYNEETQMATMEVRNTFVGNRELEIMSPHREPFKITITDIYDADGNVLESENHPKSKAYFKAETKLKPFDFVR